MPLEDDFSDILSKAMRGQRIAPSQLGRMAGISAAHITNWAAGRGAPRDGEARALAGALGLDPAKLSDSATRRWQPGAVNVPEVRHHPQNPHPSNGYVFFLEGGKQAALVDPAGLARNLLKILRDGEYSLQYILVTHKHADHCDATAEIAAAFPKAEIVMHKADVAALGPLAPKALLVRDGEELPFGDDVKIRMLHTPGHTDGSSSYVFRSNVFTGDTLFAGSVGGAYGDQSTYEDIINSVRTKLFTLPDETVVMPGHGPPSKIGWEKQHNPFIR